MKYYFYVLGQFMSKGRKKKVQQLGGFMLWQSWCCSKQDWRGWGRDFRGWFIAICHNGVCAQSWNLRLHSALIKPVGVRPHYSVVTCQKISHVPQWDCTILFLSIIRSCFFFESPFLMFMTLKCSDVRFLGGTCWHRSFYQPEHIKLIRSEALLLRPQICILNVQ